MAAEEATGSGATVTLAADARPFEQALEKAAADSKTWGRRIADNLATMNLMEAGGRFEGFKSQIESLGKMGVGDIGQKLGGGLGAGLGQAAGLAFGGPFGAMIGNFVGGTIGEQVGGPLAEGIRDAVSEDGLARDAALAGTRIGESLTSGWGDILNSPLDEAWEKVQAKAGEVWEQVGEFASKSLYRLTQGIDLIWDSVRQPIAAVSNWVQELAVRFGLVEDSTDKWGDAVLNVKDVGKTVVESLAWGLGYLAGWFEKLGGFIGKFLIAPLTIGLGAALQAASDGLRSLVSDPAVKLALRAAGVDVDGIADGLGRVGGDLTKAGVGIVRRADEMIGVDPLTRAAEWAKGVAEFLVKGKEAVERDAPKPPPPSPPAPPAPLETVKAVLADSREAANIRARSGGALDAQLMALDRVAKNGEKQVEHQKDMVDLMRELWREVSGSQIVKPF